MTHTAPTLVLLPGMDGTGLLFRPLIDVLAGRYPVRVVRYPVDRALGYAALMDLVRSQLPVDEPFVLLGESFSGPVAVALAATRPAQLKGLILCASFVRNPRPYFSGLRPLARTLPLSLVPLTLLRRYVMGHFATRELNALLAQAIAQVSPAVLRARLVAVLAVDVSEQLSALTLPILYLRASHDRVIPAAAAELTKRLNPRVCLAEIDAPHFLLQAAPVAAARAIDSFLRVAPEP